MKTSMKSSFITKRAPAVADGRRLFEGVHVKETLLLREHAPGRAAGEEGGERNTELNNE